MVDVMLDLETMGTSPAAAITAIGACARVRETGVAVGTFYRRVTLASSYASGGRIDPDTVVWWLQQNEETRGQMSGAGEAVSDACADLAAWFEVWRKEGYTVEVWGDGATFDNVIMKETMGRLGMPVPWHYRADRCYRTLRSLFPQTELIPERQTACHHALHDAIHQSQHLHNILVMLGLGGEASTQGAEITGDLTCPSTC